MLMFNKTSIFKIKNLRLIIALVMMSGCALLFPPSKYEKGTFERSDIYRERMSGQYLSEQAQISSEELKLKSLYRKCIEDNYGKPEQIKNMCEPILAPLRISANLNTSQTMAKSG